MGQVKTDGIEILRVLCGSRAYGLHDEDSDYDYHGVYVVPTHKILSIGYNLKETSWIEGQDQDNTAWEVGHFLKMAIQCNPTVLETFVAPVEQSPWIPVVSGGEINFGHRILALFPHVLSRQRIYDAFRGYASNQRKKMFEPYGEDKERRAIKASVAYIRSLYHGTVLLANGMYSPLISQHKFRTELLEIKAGKWGKGAIIALSEDWEGRLKEAYENSTVQLEADLDTINAELLDIRKELW